MGDFGFGSAFRAGDSVLVMSSGSVFFMYKME